MSPDPAFDPDATEIISRSSEPGTVTVLSTIPTTPSGAPSNLNGGIFPIMPESLNWTRSIPRSTALRSMIIPSPGGEAERSIALPFNLKTNWKRSKSTNMPQDPAESQDATRFTPSSAASEPTALPASRTNQSVGLPSNLQLKKQ
ncbi:hypothetical protein IAT40_007923 [Kwoniella sp. CBS 6097]